MCRYIGLLLDIKEVTMSKAIKFKNNTYLDSSSIVHNKEPLSEEDIDHLKELIENTHKCTRYDEKAIEIVMSEMDEYFSDKHDLKIAEEIIKNRLATYLSESQ